MGVILPFVWHGSIEEGLIDVVLREHFGFGIEVSCVGFGEL